MRPRARGRRLAVREHAALNRLVEARAARERRRARRAVWRAVRRRATRRGRRRGLQRGGRRGGAEVAVLRRIRRGARACPTFALAAPALAAASGAGAGPLLEQRGAEHGGLCEARHASRPVSALAARARRLTRHARRALQHKGGLGGEGAELGNVAVEAKVGVRDDALEGPAARATAARSSALLGERELGRRTRSPRSFGRRGPRFAQAPTRNDFSRGLRGGAGWRRAPWGE